MTSHSCEIRGRTRPALAADLLSSLRLEPSTMCRRAEARLSLEKGPANAALKRGSTQDQVATVAVRKRCPNRDQVATVAVRKRGTTTRAASIVLIALAMCGTSLAA